MLYEVALSMINGIGPVTARMLLAHFGSAEAVFRAKPAALREVPGIRSFVIKALATPGIMERATQEIEFARSGNIRILFFTDDDYPRKLKHTEDCPVVLYADGIASFGAERVVSIVGTRSATEYGLQVCRQIVAEMAPYNPVIASGLATGIDSMAHRAALDNGLQTWAAVGHGLDMVYPYSNHSLAAEIRQHGAIVSEFVAGTGPEKEHFPARNRIVAGMADVTIVVESSEKGGSLITARLAVDYSRDLYAVPGRCGDVYSAGCNRLIRENKAAIFTSVAEMVADLGWTPGPRIRHAPQVSLFTDLEPLQQQIADLLAEKGKVSLDDISLLLKLPVSKVNAEILTMELKGILKVLPGKMVSL